LVLTEESRTTVCLLTCVIDTHFNQIGEFKTTINISKLLDDLAEKT